MSELVSIIIPLFNAEKWIGETIDSCINQTYKNVEIIIVDDGSTDNSYQVANGYASNRVKVIKQENKGGCTARNEGLKLAQGDYIQFLDADDLLHNQKIEYQIDLLKAYNNLTLCSSKYAFFKDNLENAVFQKDNGWKDYDKPIEWLTESLKHEVVFPIQAWLTPRPLIQKAGLWNESIRYLVDNEYFSRVILNSEKIIYCNEAISYYRKGHISASHRKDLVGLQSRYKSKLLVIKNILEVNDNEEVRRACAFHLHHFLFGIYPEHPALVNEVETEIKKLNTKYKKNLANGKMWWLGYFIGWKQAKKFKQFYYRHK